MLMAGDGVVWGVPLPPALLGVVSFSMSVVAKMHGKLEHASH